MLAICSRLIIVIFGSLFALLGCAGIRMSVAIWNDGRWLEGAFCGLISVAFGLIGVCISVCANKAVTMLFEDNGCV